MFYASNLRRKITSSQAEKIFNSGVEKISLNTLTIEYRPSKEFS